MPKVGLMFRAAVAVLTAGIATVASAGPVPLDFSIGYGANGDKSWEVRNPEGNATADDYAAEGTAQTDDFTIDWDLSGKYDPTINGAFSVTNLLGVTQTFTLNVTVPVPAIPGGTVMGGSVGGSFSDADGAGGATFATSGTTAVYTALIDGASVATLHPSPVSLSVATPFDTAVVPAVNFGLPGVTAPGPALTTDMSIQLKFTLSAHDTAAITSVFVVQPVPEPSTIVLALMGLGCGLFMVRRRNRA
jgi:hypothetical protein